MFGRSGDVVPFFRYALRNLSGNSDCLSVYLYGLFYNITVMTTKKKNRNPTNITIKSQKKVEYCNTSYFNKLTKVHNKYAEIIPNNTISIN